MTHVPIFHVSRLTKYLVDYQKPSDEAIYYNESSQRIINNKVQTKGNRGPGLVL